ncbi:MAG TPA: hypothetical protein DDY31_07430 [Lachnospiraceae bacterium]|nr:hypothetical protein [Lachnospiraceae bacterium]
MAGVIREAERGDLIAVKRMTDEYIGKDFYTLPYLERILKRDNEHLYIYVDGQDTAVAYLYFLEMDFKDAMEFLHIPDGVLSISRGERVGIYKTACTKKEWRRKGILTLFLDRTERMFADKALQYILFTALQRPDGTVPVHKAVTEVGFFPVSTLKQPWVHTHAYCPYCKMEYCVCDGVIYIKERKNTTKNEDVAKKPE